MPDLLVKLYTLPDVEPSLKACRDRGVEVRRAMAYEKRVVVDWVAAVFGAGWASECDVAFVNQPISCFVAHREKDVLGFACHDATNLDYFGPTGVLESERGNGIGKALLLATLRAMHERGYAYAIIGGAGPEAFYRKTVGASVIPDSSPGIYVHNINPNKPPPAPR